MRLTLSASRRWPSIPITTAPSASCPSNTGCRLGWEVSADPKADLKRADELASRAIALNPNQDGHHFVKGMILLNQARYDESAAENEQALALNPADVEAYAGLGWDYF